VRGVTGRLGERETEGLRDGETWRRRGSEGARKIGRDKDTKLELQRHENWNLNLLSLQYFRTAEHEIYKNKR